MPKYFRVEAFRGALMTKGLTSRVVRLACAAVLIAGATFPRSSVAQATLDPRIFGMWIHRDGGSSLEFRQDMSVNLNFTGQPGAFNGRGSIAPCTRGGGNICIEAERFDCSYHYSFSGGELNLQFKDGRPDIGCKAANGDYRKEDK